METRVMDDSQLKRVRFIFLCDGLIVVSASSLPVSNCLLSSSWIVGIILVVGILGKNDGDGYYGEKISTVDIRSFKSYSPLDYATSPEICVR